LVLAALPLPAARAGGVGSNATFGLGHAVGLLDGKNEAQSIQAPLHFHQLMLNGESRTVFEFDGQVERFRERFGQVYDLG
jgi:hypothetical protein